MEIQADLASGGGAVEDLRRPGDQHHVDAGVFEQRVDLVPDELGGSDDALRFGLGGVEFAKAALRQLPFRVGRKLKLDANVAPSRTPGKAGKSVLRVVSSRAAM